GQQVRANLVTAGPDAQNAVPALKRAPCFPRQGRDAVAEPNAGLIEVLCQAQRARAKLSVGRRVKRAFYRACDDRSPGVIGPGMVDDAMAKERPVLHQPEHRVPHSPCSAVKASGAATL